jgi:hypothetical protein
MATKTKRFADDDLVEAWQGFAAQLKDGTTASFAAGTQLRGHHPVVREHPENFVLAGTPLNERPHVLDRAIEMLERDAAAPTHPSPRIDPATPLRDLLVCTRAVISSGAGACNEGRIVERADPVVSAAPEAFLPLIERMDRR